MQDFTTSGNPTYLFQAELHHPFPDWVVSKPIPEAGDFAKSASAAFADPARRLLPLTDPVSTFHSAINLFAQMDQFDEGVFNRVKAACALFDIEHDVAPYAELFAERIEKSAAEADTDISSYAIDEVLGGQRYRLLPLDTATDIVDAATELRKMAAERRIHYIMLLPAARRIVKAAADRNVEGLPQIILRLGVERMADLDAAGPALQKRASLAKSAAPEVVSAQYADALKEAAEGRCSDIECVEKIAAIDQAAGIAHKFSDFHPTPLPHEIIFSGPVLAEVEKAAKAHVCINDVLIPLDAIRLIPQLVAEFKLSKEASSSFEQHRGTTDARDISLAVMSWNDSDRRTLLRLAASVIGA